MLPVSVSLFISILVTGSAVAGRCDFARELREVFASHSPTFPLIDAKTMEPGQQLKWVEENNKRLEAELKGIEPRHERSALAARFDGDFVTYNVKEALLEKSLDNDVLIPFYQEAGAKISKTKIERLPTFEEKYNAYIKRVNRQIETGLIKKEEAIIPCLLYEKEGKFIASTIHSEPPIGAKPINGVMSITTFFKALAQGCFPYGSSFELNKIHGGPVSLHEDGHLVGFSENPQYTKAIRKYSQKMVDFLEGPSKAEAENLRNSPWRRPDDVTESVWQRMNNMDIALESFETIRTDKKADLLKMLKIPTRPSNGRFFTVKDFARELRGMTQDEVREYGNKLLDEVEKSIQPLGGANADISSRSHTEFYSKRTMIKTLVKEVRSRLKTGWSSAQIAFEMKVEVARLELMIQLHAEHDAEWWIQNLLGKNVDPDSDFFLRLCASSLMDYNIDSRRKGTYKRFVGAPICGENYQFDHLWNDRKGWDGIEPGFPDD